MASRGLNPRGRGYLMVCHMINSLTARIFAIFWFTRTSITSADGA